MLDLVKPPRLQPDATIGVFTPSSPAHIWFPEKYAHGLEQLRAQGFSIREGTLTATHKAQGYRAGTPQERADEFMQLIEDPTVDALMSTIGGYNSASLLPFLDFEVIRRNPKVISGYSDVTSLHMAIMTQARVSTFYGPAVVPTFGEHPGVLSGSLHSFIKAVTGAGRRRLQPFPKWSDHFRDAFTDAWKTDERLFQDNAGWQVVREGQVTAPMVVANLNTLLTLAGTRFFPNLSGTLLLIEEMNAPMNLQERNLRQLDLMGVFDQIVGLMVGKPERFRQQDAPFRFDELLLEIIGEQAFPIVTGVDCGHTHPSHTIAQGTPAFLHARVGGAVEFILEEDMVR